MNDVLGSIYMIVGLFVGGCFAVDYMRFIRNRAELGPTESFFGILLTAALCGLFWPAALGAYWWSKRS